MRDRKENDSRDSDEGNSGCGILVQKSGNTGSVPTSSPSETLEYTCQSLVIALSYFFPEKSAQHEMIPVGDFQIKYDNKTKKGEQIFVRRSGIAIKWPGGRTGPPRDSPNVVFTGNFVSDQTEKSG